MTTGIVTSLGVIGLVVVLVSQVRINSANFYVASLCFDRVVCHFSRSSLPRKVWVVLIAIVTFLLMLTNVFSYIATALAWQGIVTVSWVGIVVTHLLVVSRRPEIRALRLPTVTRGFAVWAVSAAIGLVALESGHSVASQVAPLISLGASVVLYLLNVLLLDRLFTTTRVTDDPGTVRDDDRDQWLTRTQCSSCELSYTTYEVDAAADHPAEPLCLQCQMRPLAHQ